MVVVVAGFPGRASSLPLRSPPRVPRGLLLGPSLTSLGSGRRPDGSFQFKHIRHRAAVTSTGVLAAARSHQCPSVAGPLAHFLVFASRLASSPHIPGTESARAQVDCLHSSSALFLA